MSVPAYPAYKDSGVEWVGDVPSHWSIIPLFSVADECDRPNLGMVENNLLSLSYGAIVRKDINDNDGLLPASFETYQVVEPGDIVWRLTDLQNDKRSLRTAAVRERGIITSAYLATRPHGLRSDYMNYLLRAYDQQKVFYSMGGGLRQSMKFADVKWLPLMRPPPAEQTAIAAFLDRETGKIDALVEEQRRLIALLKEKRQAVISHAVTKGLNACAPLKPSGIEWLGDIPAHWEVKRLKHVARLGNGSTPARDNVEFWADGHIPWLNSSVVNSATVESSEQFVTEAALTNCHLPMVNRGALLIALTGQGKTRGMCSILEFRATISQHLAYVDLDPVRVEPRFGQLVLWDAYDRLRSDTDGAGSTKGAITCEHLAGLPLPVPPKEEQCEIVLTVGRRLAAFEAASADAQEGIALLQERRAALISAAVTGKIDVRGLVATPGAREAA